MFDFELPRVEELAGVVGAAPVDAVTGDGMPQMFEMDTDLVRPARAGTAFKQAEFSIGGHDFPCRLGCAGTGPVRYRHALAVDRVARDGPIDHAGRGAGFAANHSQIGLPRAAVGELRSQRRVRSVVFCHEDAAACVFVQPVHHARTHGMTPRGKLGRVMQQGVDQCPRPIAGRGMDDEAGRFVEADEIVVLVEDFDRNVFRHGVAVRLRGRGFLGADFVSRVHGGRGFGSRTVDRDQTRADGPLPARAAHLRPCPGEPTVEARGGCLGDFLAGVGGHCGNAVAYRPFAQGLPLRSFPR